MKWKTENSRGRNQWNQRVVWLKLKPRQSMQRKKVANYQHQDWERKYHYRSHTHHKDKCKDTANNSITQIKQLIWDGPISQNYKLPDHPNQFGRNWRASICRKCSRALPDYACVCSQCVQSEVRSQDASSPQLQLPSKLSPESWSFFHWSKHTFC